MKETTENRRIVLSLTSEEHEPGEYENPVSGMRAWEVKYISSTCPHCGYESNRTEPSWLDDESIWMNVPFECECEGCGSYYWVEANDDDR